MAAYKRYLSYIVYITILFPSDSAGFLTPGSKSYMSVPCCLGSNKTKKSSVEVKYLDSSYVSISQAHPSAHLSSIISKRT